MKYANGVAVVLLCLFAAVGMWHSLDKMFGPKPYENTIIALEDKIQVCEASKKTVTQSCVEELQQVTEYYAECVDFVGELVYSGGYYHNCCLNRGNRRIKYKTPEELKKEYREKKQRKVIIGIP